MHTITTSVEIAAAPEVVRDKVRPIAAIPKCTQQTDHVRATVPGFRSFAHLFTVRLYTAHHPGQ